MNLLYNQWRDNGAVSVCGDKVSAGACELSVFLVDVLSLYASCGFPGCL